MRKLRFLHCVAEHRSDHHLHPSLRAQRAFENPSCRDRHTGAQPIRHDRPMHPEYIFRSQPLWLAQLAVDRRRSRCLHGRNRQGGSKRHRCVRRGLGGRRPVFANRASNRREHGDGSFPPCTAPRPAVDQCGRGHSGFTSAGSRPLIRRGHGRGCARLDGHGICAWRSHRPAMPPAQRRPSASSPSSA